MDNSKKSELGQDKKNSEILTFFQCLCGVSAGAGIGTLIAMGLGLLAGWISEMGAPSQNEIQNKTPNIVAAGQPHRFDPSEAVVRHGEQLVAAYYGHDGTVRFAATDKNHSGLPPKGSNRGEVGFYNVTPQMVAALLGTEGVKKLLTQAEDVGRTNSAAIKPNDIQQVLAPFLPDAGDKTKNEKGGASLFLTPQTFSLMMASGGR